MVHSKTFEADKEKQEHFQAKDTATLFIDIIKVGEVNRYGAPTQQQPSCILHGNDMKGL